MVQWHLAIPVGRSFGPGRALGEQSPGPMDEKPHITAVVITLDEADRIRGALESVQFADDIVVVDGGSADPTCDTARACGARVLYRAFDDFGAQRQFALEQARGDWVFMLDADERVSPALAQAIQRAVQQASASTAGFLCRRRNHYLGRRIRHAGWAPDWNLRLVRRVRSRVSPEPVHESLVVEGAVERLDGDLIHVSHRDLAHHLRKIALYSRLWATAAAARGRRARWWDLLLRPAIYFGKRYFLGQGFRDGLPGFLLCVMGAFHVFFKYAALKELELRGRGLPEDQDGGGSR